MSLVVSFLVGCSPAPAGPLSTASGAPPSASTSTPAGAPSSAPSAAPSQGSSTEPVVDLTFTGTLPLHVKGNGGTCVLGHAADGSVSSFGWTATESDFNGLGESFAITEVPGGDAVDVKWLIGQGLAFFGRLTGGVTLSPDRHLIGLDADLPPSGAATEHVRGTIACP